jgi:hypothetical protein
MGNLPTGDKEFKDLKEVLSKQKESKIEKGSKTDFGKIKFHLIPGDALEALAEVYTYGTIKYAPENWRKGMSWSRIFGGIMRHAWAFWRGEEIDEESGMPHIIQAAWGCFTLYCYSKTRPEFDDRIKDLVDSDLIIGDNYEIKQGWYTHFKGGRYQVVDVAKHSESLKPMVVYQNEAGETWCRPVDMFLGTVSHEGKNMARFFKE